MLWWKNRCKIVYQSMISNSNTKRHYIFIDESGTSDVKSYETQPYFTVIGLVVSDSSRLKIKNDFEELKQKHFGSKGYVIHNTEIVRHLKTETRINNFAADLKKFLCSHNFFIISTVIDKQKAFRLGWDKQTILDRSYRILFSNLLKFLIAKDLTGQIISEASNAEQDIFIYKNMFHYLVNGISNLNITPIDAKKHLTSVSFVTKLNNDPEEQMADLYGVCPRLNKEIIQDKNRIKKLNPIQKVLLESFEKKLFVGAAIKQNKKKLYKAINPLVELP